MTRDAQVANVAVLLGAGGWACGLGGGGQTSGGAGTSKEV